MQSKFLAFLLLTSIMCSPAFAQTADKPLPVEPVAAPVAQPLPTTDKTPAPAADKTETIALPTANVNKAETPTIQLPTPITDKGTEALKPALQPLPKAENAIKPTLDAKAKTQPTADKAPKKELPSLNQNKKEATKSADKPLDSDLKAPIPTPKADIQSLPTPDKKATFPALKKPETVAQPTPAQKETLQQPTAPASIESIQAENKRRLEEELKATTLTGKDIVNFPNRSSLGSLELTTLPGINESSMNGPLPMAPSVSNKDLPSEQLLGRISPEVFQEMADIERGNTFLKLQMEKEKLKTDLEKLKATYRQQRLDEISKREDVVRTRIKWWQEQEKIRLEIEKKRLEEEALEREIAEQKEKRDQLRAEAIARQNSGADKNKEDKDKKVEVVIPTLEELYEIESIRGLNSNLTAIIKDRATGATYTVKKNDTLDSGYLIKQIKSDSITGAYGNRIERLVFTPSN